MARPQGRRGARRRHRAQRDLARGMGGQSRARLHPRRHSRGAGRSRRRLGDGEKDRARRADHRPARRLSPRRDAGRSHRARQGRPRRRSSPPPRRRSSTRTASCSPAAAAPISRRRRSRRERMSAFTNLGDLIRRDRDSEQDRHHRSRRRDSAADFTFAELDTMANAVARALSGAACNAATGSPFSPPTAPNILPPITASCAPASSRCRSISSSRATTIDFIIRDCGAKLVFCDCRARRTVPPVSRA